MPSTPGFGEKLRAVFGLSPTILCLTGLNDGRVRDANDAFLSISGYTREEILGRTPLELGLWVDPAQRDEGIRQLKAGRTVRSMECRFRIKSGEERMTVDLFVQEPQSLARSRGGLGLGLGLVKRLVELHGGSVAVWSAGPGQGSSTSF